ncbi:MAG TPA: clan AA aspartic protease [Thermoanaerobaculia bacterium]|nr:clan AA aspartic protease [Thermoanaerobaculia bacterium]
MIVGEVNSLPEAVVRLAVRGPAGQEREIEAVVDTGYTGALTLPAELISELALPFRSLTRALLADGRETICATHEANVKWGQQIRRVSILAAETGPLLGMALLYGYELRIEVTDGGRVSIRELAPTPASE